MTNQAHITQTLRTTLPGTPILINETSTTTIRVSAKPAAGEKRGNPALATRNNAIAEALAVAGYSLGRRGNGEAVYVHTRR